jgi:hypothetical protein
MVSVLASSVVIRGFEPRSGQNKDYIKFVCVASKNKSLNNANSHTNRKLDYMFRNISYAIDGIRRAFLIVDLGIEIPSLYIGNIWDLTILSSTLNFSWISTRPDCIITRFFYGTFLIPLSLLPLSFGTFGKFKTGHSRKKRLREIEFIVFNGFWKR